MCSEIKILGQILALDMVIFCHFGGQKSRYLDFFTVVLELFRNSFWTLKAYFWVNFHLLGSKNDLQNQDICQILTAEIVIFNHFWG